MSLANWTLLTGLVSSGIVAAVLYFRLRLANEKLKTVQAAFEFSERRRGELSTSLTYANRALAEAQKAAVDQYERYSKALAESISPGPGATSVAVDRLRETIASIRRDRAAADALPPAGTAKPKI